MAFYKYPSLRSADEDDDDEVVVTCCRFCLRSKSFECNGRTECKKSRDARQLLPTTTND